MSHSSSTECRAPCVAADTLSARNQAEQGYSNNNLRPVLNLQYHPNQRYNPGSARVSAHFVLLITILAILRTKNCLVCSYYIQDDGERRGVMKHKHTSLSHSTYSTVASGDTADAESTSVSSVVQIAMSFIQATPPHSVGMEIEIWWLA
jgi:hypothetical protein